MLIYIGIDYFMVKIKNNLFFIAVISIIGYVGFISQESVFAQTQNNIYVDQNLASDCVSGNYSIANRFCDGSDGNAYNTIQKAVNAVSIGGTIYMRGGIYRENNGNTEVDIEIPYTKNGDSWEAGHYTTLTSYPGEWAIIDGEGTAPKGNVLGMNGMSYCSTCVLRYWKFERFEITGGGLVGDQRGGSGLWIPEGPFIMRYLYIRDNWDDQELNNPAGVVLYRPQNSFIEYNYFYHNGCNAGSNCRQIAIFNDYCDELNSSQCQNPPFANTVNDINRATRGNTIAYNLFDGGPTNATIGLGYKASQLLDPSNGSLWTNKLLGDKVHHNIFLNHSSEGARLRQDYLQFYNNIVEGNVTMNEYHSSYRLKPTIYNNTILTGSIRSWSYADGSGTDEPFNPWEYVYNNIFDYSPTANNESRALNWFAYANGTCSNIDTSNMDITNNYVYRPQTATHVYMSGKTTCGGQYGQMSLSEFNTDYGESNYYKASSEGADNLMNGLSGANAYITRGAHIITGSIILANGGIGGVHPYLANINMPSYLGATNPSDYNWVAGVLSLANTAILQAGDSNNPSWIEGNVSDAIPPSAPQNLSVN